jgi:DNA-binding GntR family transcriptional regulator
MFFCMRTSPRRTTVSDVVEQLRLLVITGELVGGEPLRLEQLAARFGVSRTPLREAIARLEVDGLLATLPHRRTVVFKPSGAELLEIFEIRLVLEPGLARAAAGRAHPDAARQLQSIAAQMTGAAPWEAARLGLEFDSALCAMAGKPRMARIVHTLRYQSDPHVRVLVGSSGHEQAQAGHRRQVAAAVLAGDGELAAGSVRAQLRATLAALTDSLRGQSSAADARGAA